MNRTIGIPLETKDSNNTDKTFSGVEQRKEIQLENEVQLRTGLRNGDRESNKSKAKYVYCMEFIAKHVIFQAQLMTS